jgi:glycosyltransferase involved in cell wall biosynthesis
MQEPPLGGIGRQLASLVPLIAKQVDTELLTDARLPAVATELPQHPLRGPVSARGVIWLQLAAPRWLAGFDGVFHCPFYGLPYRQPVPMIVTIHDLTFEDHPDWYDRSQTAVFRAQARHAARTARRIVTVSDHVRGRVVDRYDVSPDRVLVSPPGIPPGFSPHPDPARLTRLLDSLQVRAPYVVALGGARRRRLDIALAAWRRLRAAGAESSLVVVGSERPPPEAGVVSAGSVDDGSWALLLAGAAAFCYPTSYEGFGMPALEAAASGTPVVCARVGALPEVLGSAAAWCDAPTPEVVASELASVLEDDVRAKELRVAGIEVARGRANWDRGAAVMVQAYREAAEATR